MKEPLNPLPWYSNDDIYISIHSTDPVEDECVCQDLYREDAEYLVLACNNFPKAIELLKNVYDGLDYQSQGFIDKFLKEIES
jgi:hypothetical protein